MGTSFATLIVANVAPTVFIAVLPYHDQWDGGRSPQGRQIRRRSTCPPSSCPERDQEPASYAAGFGRLFTPDDADLWVVVTATDNDGGGNAQPPSSSPAAQHIQHGRPGGHLARVENSDDAGTKLDLLVEYAKRRRGDEGASTRRGWQQRLNNAVLRQITLLGTPRPRR